MKTKNTEAKAFVHNCQPFKANHLSGETINGVYIVKSFGHYPIFAYKDGKWYENTQPFILPNGNEANNTKKQATQVRPTGEITNVNLAEISELIATGTPSDMESATNESSGLEGVTLNGDASPLTDANVNTEA